jgi:hypothetical protein
LVRVYLVVSPGGQRQWVRKSTKKRKRSEAKEILDVWQKTADRAAAGNLDQARIREIVLETAERVTGKRTDSPTVSEWLQRWIRTKIAVEEGLIDRNPVADAYILHQGLGLSASTRVALDSPIPSRKRERDRA